ncbi:MAG TPA: CBS domain-containing protein, partial [Pirellula sp.]|nr:CBS domain-containing protein [Pirellula sp.]
LEDGEQAGLLESVQRDIVQNMFAYGSEPISRYCMPLRGLRTVQMDLPIEEAKQVLIKSHQQILPVLHSRDKRLVGYYEAADLLYAENLPRLRAISTFEESAGQISVLNKMVSQDTKLGRIVNASGQLVGVVLRDRLIALMLQRT